MSDTSFPYEKINAPNLTSSGYGEGVKSMVDNINSNFEKLANYDFHKGGEGRSVKSITISMKDYIDGKYKKKKLPENIDMFELEHIYAELCYFGLIYSTGNIANFYTQNSPTYINMGSELVTLIITELDEIEKNEIIDLYNNYVVDGFGNPKDPVINDGGLAKLLQSHILYIFPYIYFDESIYENINNGLSGKNSIDYTGTYQYACEIEYTQQDSFNDRTWFIKAIFNKTGLHPTIYYDKNKGDFCWKFGDNETGLLARGPEGKAGESGIFALVKLRNLKSGEIYEGAIEIAEIFNSGSWVDLSKINSEKLDGVNCIAVPYEEPIDQYWLTQITVNNNSGAYFVVVNNDNRISFDTNISTFYEWMKSINAKEESNGETSWSKVKGLFLPYGINNEGKVKAHMIYGKWETKSEDNRKYLHLSPVILNDNNEQPSYNKDEGDVSFTIDYKTYIKALEVTGDTTIKGTLNVGNISNGNYPVSIAALNVTAAAIKTLEVTGDTTIKGTLNVGNISNGNYPVSIAALNVDSITPSRNSDDTAGTLKVDGDLTCSDLTCNEINGKLKTETFEMNPNNSGIVITGTLYKTGNIVNVQLSIYLDEWGTIIHNFAGIKKHNLQKLIKGISITFNDLNDAINSYEDSWCYVPYIHPDYSDEKPVDNDNSLEEDKPVITDSSSVDDSSVVEKSLSEDSSYYYGAVFKSTISDGKLILSVLDMFKDTNQNILLYYDSKYSSNNNHQISLSFTHIIKDS